MSEREKIVENFVENIHCATYEERYLKKIINNTTLINRGICCKIKIPNVANAKSRKLQVEIP